MGKCCGMFQRKFFAWLFAMVLLIVAIVVYWRYYFVYATGTKAGILNTFQEKGFLFKTYEGKIIQSGFRANIQSNEFEFSVTNKKVARLLLDNSGLEVRLHYQRYLGVLPWRGLNAYIVDSVYDIRDANGQSVIKPK